ncbi:hypothetical protein B6S44_09285 [Bosea sp. Tri-44]|uniref:hypothetical protein n=1 Tax=Bosea sp. Tri-44 TaxID=1972137 RepID=UPI00100E7262|nr:hypothetical protein [Bosea sp. Tri-44]RXT55668.1 hypothetical protein B6S44_09285 [Bosea sp. Tri-44]
MISWQQDQRPVRSAAESAAARQLAISRLTVAAQTARKTGEAQTIDDLEFHMSSDDDDWLWTTLAEQYKCDFSGPYSGYEEREDGKLVNSRGYFLVKPRKEGPRPLWKNVIVYDTKTDGVELVRATIEVWLDVRWHPKRIVERPSLYLIEVRLQTHETAHELVEAHGGLLLRAGALGEPSSRRDFFGNALFEPKLMRFFATSRRSPRSPSSASCEILGAPLASGRCAICTATFAAKRP